MLPFVILGLVTGSVYGLVAVGLVLTYKTSGIFNFAHGALATVSAYVFYVLSTEHGLAWPLAVVAAVIVAGPVMGILIERLAAAVAGVALATQVAGTVGVLVTIEALAAIIFGTSRSRQIPQFLPQNTFELAGTPVTVAQAIVFATALLATGGLWLYFRYARTGIAMRAVVDDPDLLDLAGTAPRTVRRVAWGIGSSFAALSGVLLAPLIPLTPTTLTLLVIQAFGAAAIAAFGSLPGAYAGGLVLGVAAAISTKYFTSGMGAGIPSALPFIVLFGVLLFYPRGLLANRRLTARRPPRPSWSAPWRFQALGGAAILALLIAAPSFANIHLTDWTLMLTSSLLFLSLGLLVRTSGQVSLGHVAFMAIGASAFSHLSVDQHWPWLLALIGAAVVCIPVGAILAIPAIRLGGIYLALATFGFAILVSFVLYPSSLMFGTIGVGLEMPRPELLGFDLTTTTGFYYVVLAIVSIASLCMIALTQARLGRLLRGMSDSPIALLTSGASINLTQILVFCISGALAGVAGALNGMAYGVATPQTYPALESLTYFVLIMIVVGGTPWYALMAGAMIALVPSYVSGHNVSNVLQLLFGASAIAYAVTPPGRELPRALRDAIDKVFGGSDRHSRHAEPSAPTPRPALATTRLPVGSARLVISDLTVRFGGLVAVDGVSLEAPGGRVTGLIGPNGAGKTTTFNACSGLGRPTNGSVALGDRNVSRRGPAARAQLGMGRTFQKMELFDSLTVQENIRLGAEAAQAGSNPLRHIAATPDEVRMMRDAATQAISLCGLEGVTSRPVGSLSTGQRRLVELARCIAGRSCLLLLDEPSSGLDNVETAHFGEILRTVVKERGIGILLVEHDMSLVMDICDYIYVLDFGELVFEGTPVEVQASTVVQSAYLGERSGLESFELDALDAEEAPMQPLFNANG